jgi:hypothetical protein
VNLKISFFRYRDDICVLKLQTPLQFDDQFVDAIEVNDNRSQPEVGAICQVVGWGTAQKYNVRVSLKNIINGNVRK